MEGFLDKVYLPSNFYYRHNAFFLLLLLLFGTLRKTETIQLSSLQQTIVTHTLMFKLHDTAVVG